ncbi:hypothetical protein [Micromonospora sp. NBC_01813]|nr:hypothetical protein [Micromonospora sp. NBC_01813]WSA11094.1 hypothetical protein OG958_10165 [Micromonospora sp. NBC_01813]
MVNRCLAAAVPHHVTAEIPLAYQFDAAAEVWALVTAVVGAGRL